ncbi:MAG TPA: hypothetical protein VGL91_04275 [Acidobacteriota bacterium]|jgi:hypothetical protein
MSRYAKIVFGVMVVLIFQALASVGPSMSPQEISTKEVAATQNAKRSRMDEFLAQEQKASQLAREGWSLTKEQAMSLEEALATAPGDLEVRAKLMGYYFAPVSQPLGFEARIQARRKHILWLINNRPDSALLMTSEATLDPRGHSLADAEGYEQAKKAWLKQTASKDANAALLGNAGRFFYLPDKALAAEFFARARRLEPENSFWLFMQGSVMAFAVAGITQMNQNGFPGPADPAEAGSDFAKTVRRELETLTDTALLAAVARELTARGFMAQSMAQRNPGEKPPVDALGLAESLLKRVQDLDPGKSEPSFELAGIYELRGMSATSKVEKERFARARYEQLVKATAGLSANDPASSPQLLTVARASLDAGDLERAQSIANSLVALVPKMKVDPQLSAEVDTIWHHSHLILGRVALRNGDLETAKANLLEAGHVGGGGSLTSFGPNMALAKELLEKGEKDTVLQYLEMCRKFWHFSNKLDPWIAAIRKGEMPDFGANLNY